MFGISTPPGATFTVVSGSFLNANGQPRNWVDAIDLTTGQNTGWAPANICPFPPIPNHPCGGLHVFATATDYYVAISGPGGQVGDYDAVTGQLKWTAFADGDVDVVYLFNNVLYVGGHFGPRFAHSTTAAGLVAVDPTTGDQFTDFQPSASHLTTGNTAMVGTANGACTLGGPTTVIGGTTQVHLALFPGA